MIMSYMCNIITYSEHIIHSKSIYMKKKEKYLYIPQIFIDRIYSNTHLVINIINIVYS